MAGDRPDRHGDLVGAGDLLACQVDGEAVLGELSGRGVGRLDLRLGLDAVGMQVVEDLAGTVGGVAVDRGGVDRSRSCRQ
jgi:hypothetical protein